MELDTIIDRIKKRNELDNGTVSSQIDALIKSRLSAKAALEARQAARNTKYSRTQCPYSGAHMLPLKTLLYYEDNYKNCTFNPQSISYAMRPAPRTPDTKHRYYQRTKYVTLIAEAFNDFKSAYNRIPSDDDEMLEYLYSRLPQTAFDASELDIWQRIYLYMNKQDEFTAVKRTDRRTKHTESTYSDFAKWFLAHDDEYSSNDRYFITGFITDCNNSGVTVSRTAVDDLLRYDASPDCFADGDLTALGFNTPEQQTAFFDALNLIKDASKKSSR